MATNNSLSVMAQLMLPAVDEEMKTVLHFDGAKQEPFLGMMHYQMGWVDKSLEPVKAASGKRIRPLTCLLTNDASGGSWEQAVPAAAAIEILHNFSLVHDDIEDVSPLRRGRPTVWKIWGEAQAINCGDAMFTAAHLAISRLLEAGVNPPTIVRSQKRFDDTCFRLTAGQYADMDFEQREEVSVDEYIEMIKGKTAALLSASAEIGAIVAGSSLEIVKHYTAFGENLGLAFQVIDDILGIWGDESRTGKSAATDIITKKKTLPVLYGLERNEELRDLYRNNQPDSAFVSDVVRLLDEVGAKSYASHCAESYSESALAHLNAASPQGQSAEALYGLVDMLLSRDM